jgi:hypothetical protein
MGFIKVRGIDFYYEEKGEGLPILLIPPSGSTASTWGGLFRRSGRRGPSHRVRPAWVQPVGG